MNWSRHVLVMSSVLSVHFHVFLHLSVTFKSGVGRTFAAHCSNEKRIKLSGAVIPKTLIHQFNVDSLVIVLLSNQSRSSLWVLISPTQLTYWPFVLKFFVIGFGFPSAICLSLSSLIWAVYLDDLIFTDVYTQTRTFSHVNTDAGVHMHYGPQMTLLLGS